MGIAAPGIPGFEFPLPTVMMPNNRAQRSVATGNAGFMFGAGYTILMKLGILEFDTSFFVFTLGDGHG